MAKSPSAFRQTAIPAAHVHGMAEPAALQQPGQGHHLGAVLSGLLRTIVAGAKCTSFGEAKDIEKLRDGTSA